MKNRKNRDETNSQYSPCDKKIKLNEENKVSPK